MDCDWIHFKLYIKCLVMDVVCLFVLPFRYYFLCVFSWVFNWVSRWNVFPHFLHLKLTPEWWCDWWRRSVVLLANVLLQFSHSSRSICFLAFCVCTGGGGSDGTRSDCDSLEILMTSLTICIECFFGTLLVADGAAVAAAAAAVAAATADVVAPVWCPFVVHPLPFVTFELVAYDTGFGSWKSKSTLNGKCGSTANIQAWIRLWLINWLSLWNCILHMVHGHTPRTRCIFWCWSKWFFVSNVMSHWSHANGFSVECCVRMCFVTFCCVKNVLWQCGHVNVFMEVDTFIGRNAFVLPMFASSCFNRCWSSCSIKLYFIKNCCEQWWHW